MRIHLATAVASLFLCAAPAGARQSPELVAEAGRELHDSLGGGARAFRIESKVLEQTRRVVVVLPESFALTAAERRYPVVLFLDGEANLAPYSAVAEQLARNGLIPECILVGIENVDPLQGRLHDLTPPGLSVSGSGLHEGGDLFLDFVEQELLPAVDRQFRGAPPRTLIGHSSGGILATYAAATRPTWRAVVCIDAPIQLGESWLAKKLTARAAAKPPPLRYAAYWARFPWPDDAWKALAAAAPPTWKLHREQLAGEGHETLGMLAAYLGLREVFADYSRLAGPQTPTTRILPYYAAVSASFGTPLVPPQRVLRDVVEDLLMEGRGAAAREAYAMLATGYGAPADGAELLAQIAEVEQRPPPKETVEELLAVPFPTPEEARAYLGDWVGDVWMNAEEPRTGKASLRVLVVDGRVVGETVLRGAPGGPLVLAWQHMRVTPNGLTFGYMNGMRPHGVLLFEGTLSGDKLAGTQRFGGIDFRGPDGKGPPELHFEFARVRN